MISLIKINVKETENPEKSGLQEFMEQSIREEKAACEDITALTGDDHTERVPEIWWVLLLSLQLSTEQHKHIRKLPDVRKRITEKDQVGSSPKITQAQKQFM